MKNRILLSILIGVLVGILDVVPMVLQKLTWDANLSAFFFWVLVSVFTFNFDIKIKGILKGIIFSFILIIPSAILIGWNSLFALLPIFIMNIILGSILGLLDKKIITKA